MNLKALTSIFDDESGATAIEYGLIAALVAVAAITALEGLGESLTGTFEYVAGKLPEDPGSGGGGGGGGTP